ncbi:SDR family oxidoreductase [Svornostia abyssi]|uniref:SDR family oxidoreductase n=1 Tax=Svornostia abyssi TaxID=2898438 RepID=A0ABY5PL16_9ACTN|nr:SDR family oxidoreductase [Parviterribacteraceae bacterium J379]
MLTLEDQHLIVVGGSSGIGLATARAALAAGATVTAIARDPAGLAAAAAATPGLHTAVADVLDPGALRDAFAAAGPVDHVYNAAGGVTLGSILDEGIDAPLLALQTRLLGSVHVVRASHPTLRPGGSIVLTGGVSTDRPVAGAWGPNVSTAAAEQLARVLAVELAPIRVNAVAPGWTDTPLWDRVLGDQRDAVVGDAVAKHLTGQIVAADDVAAAVLLLLANPGITGEVLHVDAGARLT